MRWAKSIRLLAAWVGAPILLFAATGCGQADSGKTASAAAPAYALIDDSGGQLRRDFNQARGSVRLLFAVDPVCPTCLRGLADLDDALLAGTQDPRLQVFVVHEPVIGGTADRIRGAAGLLHNPHVHHYWNASGGFGRLLGQAVGLKRDGQDVYAWDVWMIYGPDAEWGDAGPPQPLRLMHQLPPLQNPAYTYLDSKAFAQDVRAQLAALPVQR
jgi:hypothetical protein